MLGLFNFLGVALLLVLTLSSLGSQSSLQIVHIQRRPNIIANHSVAYFDTESKPGFSADKFQKDASLNALFSSCLISPALTASINADPFGNLLIPALTAIELDNPGFPERQFELRTTNYTIPISNERDWPF
jgi:hypothetical protein